LALALEQALEQGPGLALEPALQVPEQGPGQA